VQKGRIFGKPRDLQDARNMLKRLSNSPHRLYTGLAVIKKDERGEKIKSGHEETRVYMDKLSDPEISAYFKRVSPLDKAGSFDIQGKGAFFIRKIHGCFYNVVGLPMRKLYLMLKDLDVKVFVFFLYAGILHASYRLSLRLFHGVQHCHQAGREILL